MTRWITMPRPDLLTRYGEPNVDTGVGCHLSPERGGYSDETLDYAYRIGIRWAKLLNVGVEEADPRNSTYGRLLRAGIYPVSRIYEDKPIGKVHAGHAGSHTQYLRRIIAACGYNPAIVKPYVQIYNELNNDYEWGGAYPPNAPEIAAQVWYPCALAVLAEDGIPITSPTSPGGVWGGGRDWEWHVRWVREIARLAAGYPGGAQAFMEQCVIGVNNYTDNKPLDWGKGSYYQWTRYDPRTPGWHQPDGIPDYEDNNGFCMAYWYRDWVKDHTGAECAVMSLEGGGALNQGRIVYRPQLHPGLHASYFSSIAAHMMGEVVTDREVVRADFEPAPAWLFVGAAWWTLGVQPGWEQGHDIRENPGIEARMQGKARARTQWNGTLPQPQPKPKPSPILLNRLKVEYRGNVQQHGYKRVCGNVPVGSTVMVEFFGQWVRGEVKPGSPIWKENDPALPGANFAIDVAGNPAEITVAVSGAEPLRFTTQGRLPFITVYAVEPTPPTTPPEPPFPNPPKPPKPPKPTTPVWKLRFAEDAQRLVGTPFDVGNAVEDIQTIIGDDKQYILRQVGSKGKLVYLSLDNTTYVSLD